MSDAFREKGKPFTFQCCNCHWWTPSKYSETWVYGICHYHPPRATRNGTEWPLTYAEDWCGKCWIWEEGREVL